MSEQTQEEVIQAIYGHAAELMRDGTSKNDIINDLLSKGLDSESAEIVVNNLSEMRKKQKKERGQKNMGLGALWCIGGIVVTAVTYGAASGGGHYVVAYGAIVVGGLQFLQGLFQYATASA